MSKESRAHHQRVSGFDDSHDGSMSRDRAVGVLKPGQYRTGHIPISLSDSGSSSSESENGEADLSNWRAAGSTRVASRGVGREGTAARGGHVVGGREGEAGHHGRKSRIRHRKAANSNWPLPLSGNSENGGVDEGWRPHEAVDVAKVGRGLAKVDSWISEVEAVFGRSPGTIERRQLISEKKQEDGKSIWDADEQAMDRQGDEDAGAGDGGHQSQQRPPDGWGRGVGAEENEEEEQSDDDDEEEDVAVHRRIQIMTDYQARCAKCGKSPVPLVSGALVSGKLPAHTLHPTHPTPHTSLTPRPAPCTPHISRPAPCTLIH